MNESASILNDGVLSMVTGSGPVVQAVLIILIIMSVWSWTITVAKWIHLRRAQAETKEFSNLFWETRNFARIDDSSKRLNSSPLVKLFESGYRELTHALQDKSSKDPEEHLLTVERALKREEFDQSVELERGITFLASVASSAPFIGLFGTVWGIMNAFHGLSSAKSTTIQAVAPGISEALVATAIGLAAAIPAAVAYNYFAVAVRNFKGSMNKFSSEFITLARQYVYEEQA